MYTHEIATIAILEDCFWEARIKEVYAKDLFVEKWEEGKNCTKDSQGLCRFKELVYIPRTLQQEFVREQHSLLAHRHQGIAKTFERIARDYYVPRLKTIVEETINNCDLYQRTKESNYIPQRLL